MNWKEFLKEELSKDYMKEIKIFLESERATKNVMPEKGDVFRLFKEANGIIPDIVILGQDPYPKAGDADGIAFSVRRSDRLPASLKNIFKEIEEDIGVVNESGDLTSWVKEGIFLFNTRLTVIEGKPLSHADIGYDTFTHNVLSKIQEKNPDVIFMLFGKKAEEYKNYAKTENQIITSHPSPLAVYRGFSGSKVFSKANQILKNQGKEPKSWTTDI